MPYIEKAIRASLDDGRPPTNGGELNYLISKLVDTFLVTKKLSYAHINETVGAIECSKLELYRRVAGFYEDKKIVANGDVYDILK